MAILLSAVVTVRATSSHNVSVIALGQDHPVPSVSGASLVHNANTSAQGGGARLATTTGLVQMAGTALVCAAATVQLNLDSTTVRHATHAQRTTSGTSATSSALAQSAVSCSAVTEVHVSMGNAFAEQASVSQTALTANQTFLVQPVLACALRSMSMTSLAMAMERAMTA